MLITAAYLVTRVWPSLGATGMDILREVIGDRAAARVESIVFGLQDELDQLKYRVAGKPAEPAWGNSVPTQTFYIIDKPEPMARLEETGVPFQTLTPVVPAAAPSATPVPTSMPEAWGLADLAPMGNARGEGVWSAYINDADGNVVAYRTFLQPDPQRPYTLVAVVAMDLEKVDLHFVPGTLEPASEVEFKRTGEIPKADKAAGVLLAAFNGGFKARHGQFGAMVEGVTLLPARDGLGTLAIFEDGEVELGEWGTDLEDPADIVALRQNGPLVIQDGRINQRIYNSLPQDWGYTVDDVSPTVRSGIGLSRDGRTLLYFCGPSLSMGTLARSMQAAGAYNAIQLDINNYWVLFVKVVPVRGGLGVEPLLPRLMVAYLDRYLYDSSRDFFYITVK